MLPLLCCFSDNNDHVCAAAVEACRVLMATLGAHAVKLVLSVILESVEVQQQQQQQQMKHQIQ